MPSGACMFLSQVAFTTLQINDSSAADTACTHHQQRCPLFQANAGLHRMPCSSHPFLQTTLLACAQDGPARSNHICFCTTSEWRVSSGIAVHEQCIYLVSKRITLLSPVKTSLAKLQPAENPNNLCKQRNISSYKMYWSSLLPVLHGAPSGAEAPCSRLHACQAHISRLQFSRDCLAHTTSPVLPILQRMCLFGHAVKHCATPKNMAVTRN